jgi:hypothetical protein
VKGTYFLFNGKERPVSRDEWEWSMEQRDKRLDGDSVWSNGLQLFVGTEKVPLDRKWNAPWVNQEENATQRCWPPLLRRLGFSIGGEGFEYTGGNVNNDNTMRKTDRLTMGREQAPWKETDWTKVASRYKDY